MEYRRMKRRSTNLFLFVSGLMLLAIGLALLLIPNAFHASYGITHANDPNLLSEIRAPGGMLAASAVLILLGVFFDRLRSLAVVLTILVYGSFGVARLVGMAIDGMPASGIVSATILELAIAAIGFFIYRRRASSAVSETSSDLGTLQGVR